MHQDAPAARSSCSVSSSSGPSQQSRESAKPSASSASSKISRASGNASRQVASHADELRALSRKEQADAAAHRRTTFARPGEAGAERDHQHERALPIAPCSHRLVQRHGHGGRAHVAVAVHVHEDLLHRDPRVLRGRFDDADVRLVRHQQVDVLAASRRRGESAISAASHIERTAALNTSGPAILTQCDRCVEHRQVQRHPSRRRRGARAARPACRRTS